MTTQVLQQALEALETHVQHYKQTESAIESLRQALAQQGEQSLTRYQEVRDALEQLMRWQVKNVRVWHNSSYDNAQEVLNKHDAAAPSTPQPDARKVIEELLYCVEAWERGCLHEDYRRDRDDAIQAGQEWLEENKP